jgi:hypothetical protein
VNQRGKRILGNTLKVGLTGRAKGGGLWKRWVGMVKRGETEKLSVGWAKKAEWPTGLIREKIERF